MSASDSYMEDILGKVKRSHTSENPSYQWNILPIIWWVISKKQIVFLQMHFDIDKCQWQSQWFTYSWSQTATIPLYMKGKKVYKAVEYVP